MDVSEPEVGVEDDRPLVLVAEDNELNQLLALRMLERRGYRVGLVANGREAVDAVAEGDYALVLMDCQMPELDGYAATREIRAREDHRDVRTPIVAMTANSMSGARERCLAAGMDDYLAKPLDARAFDASLKRWAPASNATLPAPALDCAAFERLRDDLGASELLPRLLERVGNLAHTLKEGAQTLAAPRMAALCEILAEQGRERSLAHAPALLKEIEEAFAEARDALEAELAEAR